MWQSRIWWRGRRICRNCWTPWTQDKNPKAKFQKAWINANFMPHNWRRTSQLCQKPEHDTVDKISARWVRKSDGAWFALIIKPQTILRESLRHHSHRTSPSKDVPPLRWMTPLLQSQERRGLGCWSGFWTVLLFSALHPTLTTPPNVVPLYAINTVTVWRLYQCGRICGKWEMWMPGRLHPVDKSYILQKTNKMINFERWKIMKIIVILSPERVGLH